MSDHVAPDTSAHTPAGHDPQPERDEHGRKVTGAVPKVEGKLGKHRDLIMVSLSLLGVLVGIMALRGSKKGSAGPKVTTDPNAPTVDPSGGLPTSTVPTSYDPSQSGTVAGYTGQTNGGGPLFYPFPVQTPPATGDPYKGFAAMLENLQDEIETLQAHDHPHGVPHPHRHPHPPRPFHHGPIPREHVPPHHRKRP